jgi:translation initiation factor IF-2
LNEKSMTETKDTTDKTLRGGARKPLSLQRTVESGHVRQNFSHGRSKSVVVEKRRTRKLAGPGGTETEVVAEAPVIETPVARKPGRPEAPPVADKSAGAAPRGLSNEERDARARALAAARQRDDVERVEEVAREEHAAAVAAAAPPAAAAPAAPAVSEAPVPSRTRTCIGTPTYGRRRSASAHVVQSCAAAARRR